MKRRLFIVFILIAICCSGCSVYMAAKQPPAKNMDVMNVGTPRSMVLGEFGQPVTSEVKEGLKVDVFAFTQGYSKGAKASRAVFHGIADVLTLGIWEAVGTPTEAVFDGTKVSYQIEYDASDRVKKVTALSEKSREEAPQQTGGPIDTQQASTRAESQPQQ